MKKLIAYIILLLAITSCTEMLDVEPKSVWGVEQFYTDITKADMAIAGMYSQLASDNLYGKSLLIFEYGTDEGHYGHNVTNYAVSIYAHNAADANVANVWEGLYQVINLSNLFLHQMKEDNFWDEDKQKPSAEYLSRVAEAKFLRGFAYFLLTSWYEEVPLRVTYSVNQSSNHCSPASLDSIYNQVIMDLQYAVNYLPHPTEATAKPGRAHKMAAHGLLARVYLKMGGYPLNADKGDVYAKALAHCDSVMSDSYFGLNGLDYNSDTLGYQNHFRCYIQNKYDTKESLFEISYLGQNGSLGVSLAGRNGILNGLHFNRYFQENSNPPSTHNPPFIPSALLKQIYDGNDTREAWNLPAMQYGSDGQIKRVNTSFSTYFTSGKYRRWEPADYADLDRVSESYEPYIVLVPDEIPALSYSGINFPILRYSDVLLMYAEASNYLNSGATIPVNGYSLSAIDALNKVRQRAGLNDYSGATDFSSFFDEIVDERMRELCMEGHRKLDLIRWGLLDDKLTHLREVYMGMDLSEIEIEHRAIFLRCADQFDVTKNLSMPYPLQEIEINNLLEQKPEWR